MRRHISKLKDEKGSVVLMGLILVAVVSVMVTSIFDWQALTASQQRRSQTLMTIEAVQQQLLAQIYDTNGWLKTAGADTCEASGFGCSAGAGGVITLKDAQGHVIYDSNAAASGFNPAGVPCTAGDGGFSAVDGNPSCPFRYDLTWSAVNCSGSPQTCQVAISGVFSYSPGPNATPRKNLLNPTRWNLAFNKGFETDSLKSSCSASGGVFNDATGVCTGQTMTCPPNQVLTKLQNDQPPVCLSTYSAQKCPTDQIAQSVSSNGSLVCTSSAGLSPPCNFAYMQPTSACKCVGTACTQTIQLVWTYPNGTQCNAADSVETCGG